MTHPNHDQGSRLRHQTAVGGHADAQLPVHVIERALNAAFIEDLGDIGDLTTRATIAPDTLATATIGVRQPGIVAGLPVAFTAFTRLDPQAAITLHRNDGDAIETGEVVATVSCRAQALLSAERIALNFMGRMSGIATLANRYVQAVSGTSARIVDTRKTTPTLRAFEKYAVRCGGADNHRFGLFDAVLIKDNHIAACGGIVPALQAARRHAGHLVKIEIEVDTLDQLREVDFTIADCILLDNMTTAELREAVAFIDRRALSEASGGVNLDTVADIAATGVDLISVGALTHSASVLDLGLDIAPQQ